MLDEVQMLGGRLTLADPARLSAEQQTLFRSIIGEQVPWANKAGFKATAPDGRLIGPFNAFLRRPEVASKFLAFDASAAKNTTLSERLREIVILTVGGVWQADYELYAHKVLAYNAGIPDAVIAALAAGEIPEGLGEGDTLAARVAWGLSSKHRVDDTLFTEALGVFGEQGLLDIALLVGEYHTTCAILTLFAVPAPE